MICLDDDGEDDSCEQHGPALVVCEVGERSLDGIVLPPNAVCRTSVPRKAFELLDGEDVVVHDGGAVEDGLHRGIPCICASSAPACDAVARKLASLGAGVVVDRTEDRGEYRRDIGKAVRRILHDHSRVFAKAARSLEVRLQELGL